MRFSPVTLIGVIAVLLFLSACATVDGQHQISMMSPTLTVVAGVAMLEPSHAASATYDAVKLEPENAALIAAFAVAAAPDRAQPIILAARRGAPDRVTEIDAATKRALRRVPALVFARIPDHEYLVRLVERATQQ